MQAKMNKYEQTLESSSSLKRMHIPDPSSDSSSSNTLYSIHQKEKQKTSWYLSSWESMEAQNVPTNLELVTYKSKIYPYHSLHRSTISTVTPEIKAVEGYQIRFCDDLFINMIREYRLSLNDVELQFGNTKYLMFDMKNNTIWKNISSEIGNRESLTSWRNSLSSEPISIPIPWCYSRDKSDSFPLNLCGHNDRLHHSVEFKLSLRELLLIRNSDGEIVDFDPSLIVVTNNLEGIAVPEMEGLYTTLTSQECDYGNCREGDDVREYFAESMYYFEDENDVCLGKKVQLKIESRWKQPISGIYWGAINKGLSEKNKSITFTSGEEEPISPIKNSKIEGPIGHIMSTKSSYKTERAYRSLFVDYQYNLGMNYWTNNVLLKEDMRKFSPGVVMGGGLMVISLIDKKSTEKFLVCSVLKYIRRFKFTNFPKTQKERLQKGCTIEPEEDY